MKSRYYLFLYPAVLLSFQACGTDSNTLISPNEKVLISVNCPEPGQFGPVSFEALCVSDGSKMHSSLGISAAEKLFKDNVRLVKACAPTPIHDEYTMISGKRNLCSNEATERVFVLVNAENDTLAVRLRAYDDGVAFRYELPGSNCGNFNEEYTEYTIPEGMNRWAQWYDPLSYEGFYPLATDGVSKDGKNQWAFPALVQIGDSAFVLLTEANISRGQCGAFMTSKDDAYRVTLADAESKVDADWHSPWRLMIMGSLGDIVESTLVTDVSDPSKISDISWIEPAPASWIYWAHNHGSKDYQIVKDYIDLAAEMDWPYVLIDWEWDTMANGGDIIDAVNYAKAKGVKPVMWYNSSTAWLGESAPQPLFRLNEKENRVKEYEWLNDIGVYGVKVDFFKGDGTSTMDYFIDLLEDGAAHRIMVTFHGATIPRGWQRTYPNLMTVEGVYGAEWYNNAPIMGPRAAAHNATLPFTRNVVGSMDYTPGTFSDSQNPHFTTHSHELALTVLFESAVQHMPDRPDIYRSLPSQVKEILKGLPTAWDDTKFLSGYPGESAVLARRKGNHWYVAGINGTDSTTILDVNLNALKLSSSAKATLISDGSEPREFSISSPAVTDSLRISCLPRGGFLLQIHP